MSKQILLNSTATPVYNTLKSMFAGQAPTTKGTLTTTNKAMKTKSKANLLKLFNATSTSGKDEMTVAINSGNFSTIKSMMKEYRLDNKLDELDGFGNESPSEYWKSLMKLENFKKRTKYSLLLQNLIAISEGKEDNVKSSSNVKSQPIIKPSQDGAMEKVEPPKTKQDNTDPPIDDKVIDKLVDVSIEEDLDLENKETNILTRNTPKEVIDKMDKMIESDEMEEEKKMEELRDKEIVEEVIAQNPKVDDPEDPRTLNKGAGRTDDTKPTPSIETVAPTTGGPSEPINLSKKMNDDPNKQVVTNVPMDTMSTTIDMIPEMRLSSDNKNEATLRNDITYFFKNFPKPLVNLRKAFTMMNKFNLPQLIRLHKRIVAILQPNKASDKKVGVVIDAEEYIRKIVGETMIDNAIKGYSIPNLEPIGNRVNDKDKDIKDIGSYEVKRGPNGGLNSQKEPIYRYIPTTQEETLEENEYDYKSGPKRLNLPPTKMRNLVQTGKRQVRNNPFLELKKGHRLNVLL